MGKGALIAKVVWPARGSLFAIIGAGAGLFADLVAFFTAFITPFALVGVFGALAIGSGLLCLQRAFLANPTDETAVRAVVECRLCDAFRFGLFATAAFALLMLVGQGETATEALARRMGLIQQDVAVIRGDVGELREMAQPNMIVRNPRTAAEYFNNAWLHNNMRRDPAAAWASVQDLYRRADPRKMDAAELFQSVGRTVVSPAQLDAEMRRIGAAKRDGTLLVVAARNAATEEEAEALMEEARRLDPQLPFAEWDMIRPVQRQRVVRDVQEQLARLRTQKARMEAFSVKYAAQPASYWFFLPQYQSDYAALVRQHLSSTESQIESYERMAGVVGR